jgi:hypothetical protein
LLDMGAGLLSRVSLPPWTANIVSQFKYLINN